MKKSPVIKKLFTFFLLLVFLTGITPKIYFHQAFARHIDFSACNEKFKNHPHLHPLGFNCHFDDLVVTVPYFFQEDHISFSILPVYKKEIAAYFSSYSHPCFSYKETRGPPQHS